MASKRRKAPQCPSCLDCDKRTQDPDEIGQIVNSVAATQLGIVPNLLSLALNENEIGMPICTWDPNRLRQISSTLIT